MWTNPREAWRFEHNIIELMYREYMERKYERIYIGHHAEFLHQYCRLRRRMMRRGEDVQDIRERIKAIYPIALKKAEEWLSGQRRQADF